MPSLRKHSGTALFSRAVLRNEFEPVRTPCRQICAAAGGSGTVGGVSGCAMASLGRVPSPPAAAVPPAPPDVGGSGCIVSSFPQTRVMYFWLGGVTGASAAAPLHRQPYKQPIAPSTQPFTPLWLSQHPKTATENSSCGFNFRFTSAIGKPQRRLRKHSRPCSRLCSTARTAGAFQDKIDGVLVDVIQDSPGC